MSIMACRLLGHCSRHNAVCALITSGAILKHIRTMSSYDEQKPDQFIEIEMISQDSPFNWPDTRLGPLEPADGRFPLPGLVGSNHRQLRPMKKQTTLSSASDLLTEELSYERHSTIFEQFLTVSTELARKSIEPDLKNNPFELLDCIAEECPYFLMKDFQDLFPNANINGSSLTIITLHKKSKSEATASSENIVELNTKCLQLVEEFISAAIHLCNSLHSAGYWADFIDPTSGQPYLESNTNVKLYETDRQYRHFGFEISNFSGCRVVQHHQLGTRPYVGCVFTKAPLDHPLIIGLVQKLYSFTDK